ncbi:MAG: nucleoside monophosphate kinase [Candidatus Sulfotelmatobacter sp.]
MISITAYERWRNYIQPMSTTNNRAAWIQGPSVQCETTPEGALLPWRLILLGAPGVGKGTQAELLNRRMRACHLSTGDVFRAAGSRPDCEQSPAIKEALGYMRRGELVPDSTVWEMVRERSGCLHCSGGFILDGFPRTLGQAESLKELMDHEGLKLTAVVNYTLPFSEIVARLGGRRTCERCKAVYHVTERPPKVEGKCDHCDARLFLREDDRPESIKVRLEAYERSTTPLIEFYRSLGLLVEVAAIGSPDDIFESTFTQLEARRVREVAQKVLVAQADRCE